MDKCKYSKLFYFLFFFLILYDFINKIHDAIVGLNRNSIPDKSNILKVLKTSNLITE